MRRYTRLFGEDPIATPTAPIVFIQDDNDSVCRINHQFLDSAARLDPCIPMPATFHRLEQMERYVFYTSLCLNQFYPSSNPIRSPRHQSPDPARSPRPVSSA